ncbi:hypothetical protein MMC07_002154 [Pseudocyphellaria aurata]|nr:hypothetical protein [Pseudocyphellaria aurata]
MSDVIGRRGLAELHELSDEQRMDTLVEMSTQMLDSLTPTQMENITFDWFRAYHATMYNCDYVEIQQINRMTPQLRRMMLHGTILARNDRSFDRLDEPTVQGLKTIFDDRKSRASHSLAPSSASDPSTNEFAVSESFFTQFTTPWATQANDLDTALEHFNISGDQHSRHAADLGAQLANLDLEGTEGSGTTSRLPSKRRAPSKRQASSKRHLRRF